MNSFDYKNNTEIEEPLDFGNFCCIPPDSTSLIKMCNYLKARKQIPADIPHTFTSVGNESIPRALVPVETQSRLQQKSERSSSGVEK